MKLRMALVSIFLLILFSTFGFSIAEASCEDLNQSYSPLKEEPVSMDEQGRIIVQPDAISNPVVQMMIDARIREGRAERDSSGRIVITPQYPNDCQIFFQLKSVVNLYQIDCHKEQNTKIVEFPITPIDFIHIKRTD
jgi:hypothetical protein